MLFKLKTVLFQAIQLSISTQFCSALSIDMTLAGASILGQRGPQSDSYGGVLRILQISSITEASPSDCLVSNSGDSLRVVFCFPSRLGNIDRERESDRDRYSPIEIDR